MNRAALERIIESVIVRLTGSEPVTPTAVTFLLRCYVLSDRADIRDALEPALARALDLQARVCTTGEQAAWLVSFSDALTLSEDDRLRDAATTLVAALRRTWGRSLDIECVAVSAEACLRASVILDVASLAADAIDELERIVGRVYKPGAGLTASDAQGTGGLANHIATSSALLTAYTVSARLPYSMLAEELMQFIRRTRWDETAGCFTEGDSETGEMLRLNCAAARVLCGLAALRRDPDYVAAVVVAAAALYADDAGRILTSLQEVARAAGVDESAAYGLALVEWLSLQ